MPLPPLPLTRSQRRLVRQLDELWNWADTKLSGRPLPEDDLRLTVLFQLTGATHRLVRAIIAQVRGDSVDGLEGRMRSMIEALINIRYILTEQKDTRARAFIVDDQRSRRKVCNWMIPLMANGKAPSMALNTTVDFWKNQEAKLAKELADLESWYGRDDLRWPSLEERARLGDTQELYVTAFWLFSHDEHLTTRGLNRFMELRDGSYYFRLGHETCRLEGCLQMAYVYYFAFLNTCSQHTGYPPPTELGRFAPVAEAMERAARPSQHQIAET